MVAQLCQRLDDLALAIELAAARVSSLPLEELIQRLNDRFSVLTGGSRTALPRQQTLRAAMAWSWDLLSERERSALRQLAIFASSFTLAAAEATCDQGIEALTALVNKSLAIFEPAQERYRLLETVREYVLDRGLGEEGLQARVRHLAYTRQFVEQWRNRCDREGSYQHHERLEASYDNIRVALVFALEHRPALALELVGLLWPFWAEHGYRTEGRRQLRAALERATDASSLSLAQAHLGAGALAYETGDFEATFHHLPQAVALAQAAQARDLEGECLRRLGVAQWNQGKIDDARHSYAQSATCFAGVGSARGLASVYACQGHLAWNVGDYAEATRCNLASQELYRELNDLSGIAETYAHLGLIARSQGDFAQARSYLEEALVLRRQLGLRAGIAVLVHHLGALAYFDRRLEEATHYLNESIALWKELGDPGWTALSLYFLGLVYRIQREWLPAVDALLEALPIRRAQNATRSVAAIQFALGTIRLEQGRLEQAESALCESAHLRYQIGLTVFCGESLDALAAVAVRRSDPERAVMLLALGARLREGQTEIEEEHPYRDEAHARAEAHLGEAKFRELWVTAQSRPPETLLTSL